MSGAGGLSYRLARSTLHSVKQIRFGPLRSSANPCGCQSSSRWPIPQSGSYLSGGVSHAWFSIGTTSYDVTKKKLGVKNSCDHQITAQWIQLVNPASTLNPNSIDPKNTSESPKMLIEPALTRDVLARLDLSKYTLVEVNPRAQPPICKIVSRDALIEKERTKLKHKKVQQKTNRHDSVVKEVQLTWLISPNDLNHKLKVVQHSFEKGYKVRVVIANANRHQDVEHQQKVGLLDIVEHKLTSYGGEKFQEERDGGRLMIEWHPINKVK